ncbi:MAG TPA: hypothetical protein VGJ21_08835 [Terracidiphilus sp.]|jgi:hypothetical protein
MSNEQEVASTPQPAAADVPQFATAEYAHIPGTERCRICGNLVSGEYYRVNNQMACSTCAQRVKDGQPIDSHSAFARAVLFGLGGALLGMILYATITISLDFSIGYFAVGVGWLVGAAMKKGSGGISGRRYQVAAVLLTYLAISSAAVPMLIHAINKDLEKRNQQLSAEVTPANPDGTAAAHPHQLSMNWAKVMPLLAKYAIASPFLDLQEGINGVIGLVILFVGMRIAWFLTKAKPLEVDGPYSGTAG